MKALIQKIKGEFPNLNFYQANLGFQEMGYEIQYFMWDKLLGFMKPDGYVLDKLRHEDVVVGGIPVIDDAYQKLKVKNPYLPCYPECLSLYLERATGEVSIASVRERIVDGGKPLFIKPKDEFRKLFNGHVVEEYRDLIKTANLPSETPVIYSEIINFLSEYRVFVMNYRVVGIKNYRGSFRYFPDFDTIDGMVNMYGYNDAPAAYALDVGIAFTESKQRTVLVEVNDASALGCYGLGPVTYAKMIAARWDEVMDITTLEVVTA